MLDVLNARILDMAPGLAMWAVGPGVSRDEDDTSLSIAHIDFVADLELLVTCYG